MTDQSSATESVFIVKGNDEYCFLYSDRAPGTMYLALIETAGTDGSSLGTQEALEVIEELLSRALHRL